MTETITFETEHALKRDHGSAVQSGIDDLIDIIDSEPALWFGGLPPVLQQLKHLLMSQKQNIGTVFGIEPPAPEPQSPPED